MVDISPFDLTDFLSRNRQAGGVNALLADALEANLAPRSTEELAPTPSVLPGLFGVGGGEQGERGEFGRSNRSRSILRNTISPTTALAGLLMGGPVGGALGFIRDIVRAPPPTTTVPLSGRGLAEVLSRQGGLGFRERESSASNLERFGNERAPRRESSTGRLTGRV